jgi:hypothetical protein
MLSEEQEVLLTGYADGDLTHEERESAECLLRNSPEARAWLRKMQQTSHKLKKLTRHTLGERFTTQVLANLAVQPPPQPAPQPAAETTPAPMEFEPTPLVQKPRLRRGMPAWVLGSTIASVVAVMVGGIMYYLHNRIDVNPGLLPKGPIQPSIVKNGGKPKAVSPANPSAGESMLMRLAFGSAEGYVEPFEELPVRLPPEPTRFAFGDLQKTNSYDYLAWELKHQQSVHLDVHVKYNARALNRLLDAFHKNGVRLSVTPVASESYNKNQPLLVYAENVPADGLAKALRELSEVDRTGNRMEPTTYEALAVSGGNDYDIVKLSRGLGVDFRKVDAPTKAHKGLAEGIVVGPQSTAVTPREVHEFLAARRAPQPGTLQVFVQLLPRER